MNKKKEKINIWDVDGCIVMGFKDVFHNEAEYADHVKKQPVCTPFANFVETESKNAKNYVITGRKESFLGDITKKTIGNIVNDADNTVYVFFPENFEYKYYHKWKHDMIEKVIDENKQTSINIFDDDLKVLEPFIKCKEEDEDRKINVYHIKSDVKNFEITKINI